MGFDVISIAPLVTTLIKIISNDKITKVVESGTIEEINKEIKQQDISLMIAQQQARFAQELAIALRIETADEVEIEEFYDNSKDGNLGVKGNEEGLNIGLSGSGKRITKRIYKFKGNNGEKAEIYQQKLNEVLTSKTQEENK
jgi:hypothetical protein